MVLVLTILSTRDLAVWNALKPTVGTASDSVRHCDTAVLYGCSFSSALKKLQHLGDSMP